MRLRYLFIFLTVVTIFLIFLYFLGHEILDLIMAMITVQFLSLGAIIEHQRRFPSKTIKELAKRVDEIEQICNNIYANVSSYPNHHDSRPRMPEKNEEKESEDSAMSIADMVYLEKEEQT